MLCSAQMAPPPPLSQLGPQFHTFVVQVGREQAWLTRIGYIERLHVLLEKWPNAKTEGQYTKKKKKKNIQPKVQGKEDWRN